MTLPPSGFARACALNNQAIDWIILEGRYAEAHAELKQATQVLRDCASRTEHTDLGSDYSIQAVDVDLRDGKSSIMMLRIEAKQASSAQEDAIAAVLFNMSIVMHHLAHGKLRETSSKVLLLARRALESSPSSIRRFLVLHHVENELSCLDDTSFLPALM